MRDTERLEKRLSKKRRNCLREPSKDYDHDPDHHHDHGAISVAFCFFFFFRISLDLLIDHIYLPHTSVAFLISAALLPRGLTTSMTFMT